MICQTPARRHEYSARLKRRLDDAARIHYAHEQGLTERRKEGRKEGELLGRITTLQDFLEITAPTREELRHDDLEQLTTTCENLQQELRNRE